MSDYIKRSDALALAWYAIYEDKWQRLKRTKVVSVDEIEGLPAADVVERKSGEWIEHGEPNEYGVYQPWYWTCSNCGAVGYHEWNFCTNCGSDMRDGGDEA